MEEQRGGKLVGKGAYGCAFSPPLACGEGSEVPARSIGKVFGSKTSFQEERKNAKIIRKIDPLSHFTVPFLGSCFVKLSDQRTPEAIHACSHTHGARRQIPQVIYRNGGRDLEYVMAHLYLYPNVLVDDVLLMMAPLLEGLQHMAQHDAVHCDIKPPNILYDGKEKRMFLIDFGILQKASKLHEPEVKWLHSWTYPYYPPEFKLLHAHRELTAILDQPKTMEAYILENFSSIGKDGTHFLKFLDIITSHDYVRELRRLTRRQGGIPEAAFVEAFKLHAPMRTDVYSLGIAIAIMLFNMYTANRYDVQNNAFVEEALTKVLGPMIRMDVTKRILPGEAYARLTDIAARHNSHVPTIGPPKIEHAERDRLYTKDLSKCELSEAKGGYSIRELRKIGHALGIGAQTRKGICASLKRTRTLAKK